MCMFSTDPDQPVQPRILVAHEKHGTYYFPASTLDELSRSALTLLTERLDNGTYRDPGASPWMSDETKDALLMAEETIEALPARMATKVKKLRAEARRQQAYHDDDRETYDRIKQFVAAADPTVVVRYGKNKDKIAPVAWGLLQARNDYEYERVELETLEVPGLFPAATAS
jgi:hypothetical protein